MEVYPAKHQQVYFYTYGATQVAAATVIQIAWLASRGAPDASGALQDYRALPIAKDGVLRNLVCYIDVVPGVGQSVIFQIFVNGVLTALTATIGAAAIKAQDLVNRVAVTAGQIVDLRVTTSVACASVRVWGAVACDHAYGT